jgi:hypothetical protein
VLASSKELGPRGDLGVLFEQGATLALRHTAPDTELDAVVQSVSSAFGDDRAMPADDGGLSLSGAADEKLVGISRATESFRDPRDSGFPARCLLK